MAHEFSEFPTRPYRPGPPAPQDPPRPAVQPPVVLVSEKQRWEYRIVDRSPGEEPGAVEPELNALGEDGWELVAVVPGATMRFYFKRPRRR